MILNENYRTAIQKYGEDIVVRLTRMGLPDNYLLAACRFNAETNKDLSEIVSLFKDWNTYVIRFTKIDVNNLSFDKFVNLIDDGKNSHGIPNVIYKDNIVTVGEIHRAKDTKLIPVDVWCIHSQHKIDNYLRRGYKFFIIRMLSQPLPYTYVMAAIHDGEVEYWDSYNYPHIEDSDGSHEAYQKALPKPVVDILYNAAVQGPTQETIKETKYYCNMNTNKIGLTESQLKQIIKESIYKTLYSLTEGKTINNRIPNPLYDEDYIDDETGEYQFLKRDKFADEYNSPEAKMKRNQRTTIKNEYKGRRLWFDFTLTDETYEANLSYLKNRSEEEWLKDGRGFGAVQWCKEPYTAGDAQRVAVNGLVELWYIDGTYFFIVRKGKEDLFLN